MPKFTIIGAGAIGGALAATMTSTDQQVTLLARGTQYDAVKSGGLELETPQATTRWRIPVIRDLSEVEFSVDDVIILAVKSQDTASLIAQLRQVPSSVRVVCTQNGVQNERELLRYFSMVYGVHITVPAVYLTPGKIHINSLEPYGVCDIGKYPQGRDEFCEKLAETWVNGGWSSNAVPDIMAWKYAKLIDSLSNMSQVIFGLELRENPATERAREEAYACFAAGHIRFVAADQMRKRRSVIVGKPSPSVGRVGASTWQSFARGSSSETDFLNGEVTLLGRLYGVPTPANDLFQSVSREIELGQRLPESMSPDEFLKICG